MAQPTPVISGEHADFSRLVVMFDNNHDWEFGRVTGGYELRTDAHSAELSGRQIFSLIPRSRISSVTFPGPGRMFLAVNCACQGDAFEIRNGRLAIDIKDGQANPGSRFEHLLPALSAGDAWQRNTASTQLTETQNVPPPALGFIVPGGYALGTSPSISPPGAVTALRFTDPTPERETTTTATAKRLQRKLAFDGIARQAPREDEVGPLDPDLSAHADPKHGTVQTEDVDEFPTMAMDTPGERTGPIVPSWPADWNQTIVGSAEFDPDRVELAQSALLKNLSRAAAQGLIDLGPPERPNPPAQPEIVPILNHAAQNPSGDTAPMFQPSSEHVRVETVMDRDAGKTEIKVPITDQGHTCLGDDMVQVADWGPGEPNSALLSDIRAQILQEFDRPDPAAILELARRFIFLGFGAEAIDLILAFPRPPEGSDILLQMADIVDRVSPVRPGQLSAQLTCSSPAAMWAILAWSNIPAGTDVDTKYVLRTFAGLPIHLRTSLGPVLVDRFLAYNDPETAVTIRDIIERATPEHDSSFQLMQAQISDHDGDMAASLAALRDVVQSGSPAAALALAQLLETTLATGGQIDPDTALLADSMATENRGTEIGRRLTFAAIRAYAASGQVDVTFQRIAHSIEAGHIAPEQAGKLIAEAHLHNAQHSSDGEFLAILYQNPLTLTETPADLLDLRHQIAERLVGLGLPQKAIELLGRGPMVSDRPDQHILARAELAQGQFARAKEHLTDRIDPASLQILAKIDEKQRNFASAAEIYGSLGQDENQTSAAWRAGAWSGVAQSSGDARAQLADLHIKTSQTENADQADDAEPTTAAARSLIGESQQTRQIIDALLLGDAG